VVRVSPTRTIHDDNAAIYLPVGIAVLVLVFAFTAVALLRSRRRAADDAVPAEGKADSMPLEGGYIALLCLVTAGLVVASFTYFGRLQTSTAGAASLRVRVDAAKWRWRFVYPGGASSIGELVVPAGRPVRFVARSEDVLHEFWVPDARFQRFVWPNQTQTWTLTFGPGVHDGVCAWFCGLQHDRMRFTVRAVGTAQFESWLAARKGTTA
jgi:cytochrome c oxidase subunit 2